MPRASAQKASWDSAGRVFWSEGAGFGTVDVHSYLPGVNRGKPLSEEPWFCLGASR